MSIPIPKKSSQNKHQFIRFTQKSELHNNLHKNSHLKELSFTTLKFRLSTMPRKLIIQLTKPNKKGYLLGSKQLNNPKIFQELTLVFKENLFYIWPISSPFSNFFFFFFSEKLDNKVVLSDGCWFIRMLEEVKVQEGVKREDFWVRREKGSAGMEKNSWSGEEE